MNMIDFFLKPLEKFNKIVSQCVFALATTLIGLIVLALTMSAVTRYVSGKAMIGLLSYLQLWLLG